jgi:hypothetical protein
MAGDNHQRLSILFRKPQGFAARSLALCRPHIRRSDSISLPDWEFVFGL